MRRKAAILLVTVLVSAFGATACGAAQDEIQKQAEEKVKETLKTQGG